MNDNWLLEWKWYHVTVEVFNSKGASRVRTADCVARDMIHAQLKTKTVFPDDSVITGIYRQGTAEAWYLRSRTEIPKEGPPEEFLY